MRGEANTVAQPRESSQATLLGQPLSIRGAIARFYRGNFAGRERNYVLWKVLRQLLSSYDTIRIVTTQGKCLRPEELILREPLQYEDLFGGSVAFLETILGPRRRELQAEFRLLGRVYNEQFSSGDAELYHSVIRQFRPNQIIEIGAGHSTWFAARALRLNGKGSLLTIDPAPRRTLPRTAKQMRSKVEDVPLKIFDKLGKDDILFIDSSHTAQEATFHVSEILPRLRPGVLIHHHDVAYPYRPTFPEEDILLDFYERNPNSYQVLCGLAYVRGRHEELLKHLVPSFAWQTQRAPGSLWVRKEAPDISQMNPSTRSTRSPSDPISS